MDSYFEILLYVSLTPFLYYLWGLSVAVVAECTKLVVEASTQGPKLF